MKNNIENELLNKYKIYVAMSKFENDLEKIETERTNKYPFEDVFKRWRKYNMRKKVIVATTLGIFLASGVAFATNIDSIKNYFRGLGDGINSAIEHEYIKNTEMNYINDNVNVANEPDKIIDNISLDAKIENFLMDDYNLSVEFDFKFDNEINKYVDLDNIHNIEIKDLIVKDENNRIIYAGNDEEAFNKYCNNYNLDYNYGEFNENYLNNGLNSFLSYHNNETKSVKLMYNMYTDKYPNSKKLYFSFGKLIITEENNENKIELDGDWKIDLDVPEKMYNRQMISYKVTNCNDNRFLVTNATVSETGFELGVVISDIPKPENPFEIQESQLIKDKKEGKITIEELNERMDELRNSNEYKNYIELLNPISIRYNPYKGQTIEDTSYIENERGEKFSSTLSPSRKQTSNFIDENKFMFYETFSLTKYEATEKLKVRLLFKGTPVIIELQRK